MKAESYLPMIEYVEFIQRKVIVNSIIYYELNASVISDGMFDKMSKRLVKLKEDHPEEWERSRYFYCMYDFDGSTGFDLYGRLDREDSERLMRIAKNVLALYRREKNECRA